MRVISQASMRLMIDVPYKMVIIEQSPIDPTYIIARPIGTENGSYYTMAKYHTVKRAREEIVNCVKKYEKLWREENSNGISLSGGITYFQFPES